MNSIKSSQLLIVVAICGILYLMIFGFFKSERPLYFGAALNETPHAEQILQMVDKLKIKPQIIALPIQWDLNVNNIPSQIEEIKNLWKEGIVSCLTWMPLSNKLEQIKQGQYKEYLTQFVAEIKTLDFPLIILFSPNTADQSEQGQEKNDHASRAELFKTTYRSIIEFFRQENVGNVLWAFGFPTNALFDQEGIKPVNYYPGNSYLDLVAMQGDRVKKNSVKNQGVVEGFNMIFEPLYRELKLMAPGKPMMVFVPTSAVQSETNPSAWMIEALETCKSWNVSAFIASDLEKEILFMKEEKIRTYFTEQPSAQTWLQKL